MKYTVIYEVSIQKSEGEWRRYGLNAEFEFPTIEHDKAFQLVKERVDGWVWNDSREGT